jgi:predicted O-methyltransferase YrrM
VSKLTTIRKIATALASDPRRLRNVIDLDVDAGKRLTAAHPGFVDGLPCCDISDLFPDFRETVFPYTFLDGTSTPLDLALLKLIARELGACRYLEVGTFRGESVANVAAVASECVTIDLSDEDFAALFRIDGAFRNVGSLAQGLKNVTFVRGDSRTLDFSQFGKVDLVFVDGDHTYEAVRHDTEMAFSVLRDQASVIVWHDYVFPSGEIRAEVLAGMLDGTPRDRQRYMRGVYPTWCAIYSENVARLPSFPHAKVSVPRTLFDVSVRAREPESN